MEAMDEVTAEEEATGAKEEEVATEEKLFRLSLMDLEVATGATGATGAMEDTGAMGDTGEKLFGLSPVTKYLYISLVCTYVCV